MTRKVTCLGDILTFAAQRTPTHSPVFRGHADMDWPLKPVLHRYAPHPPSDSWATFEAHLIDEFSQQGWSLIDNPSAVSFGGWMAIGRHHGLPTRLLDWSESPLVAAFFAAGGSADTDGCIWTVEPTARVSLNSVGNGAAIDLLLVDQSVARLDVPVMHPRFRSQLGLFTAEPLPAGSNEYVPLTERAEPAAHLQRWVIEQKFKAKIMRELDRIGIDDYSVFPDLDGLGHRIRRRLSSAPAAS